MDKKTSYQYSINYIERCKVKKKKKDHSSVQLRKILKKAPDKRFKEVRKLIEMQFGLKKSKNSRISLFASWQKTTRTGINV